MKALVLNILFIALAATMFGQKGHLVMEIVDVKSDNPQMQAQLEMMKGSETEVFYNGTKSLTKMNMMGGMVLTDILIEKEVGMKLIMNLMGNKMFIPMSQQEMDVAKASADNPMNDLNITYDKSDTKELAGFSCYKMVAVPTANPDMQFEAYITEDIKTNAAMIQGVDLEQFAGFPLEYTVNMGPMTMTTTAKTFEPTVDDAVFNVNTDGYTEMTMDEFKSSMGQMGGGMGF